MLTWILAVLAGCGAWLTTSVLLPLRTPEQFVDLPTGTSARTMAWTLQKAGVVRSRYGFLLLRLLRRGNLKAGEYRFAGSANTLTVYKCLQHGDVYTRTVLIPEGYNLSEIAHAVEAAGLGHADAFLKAATANVDLIAAWAPAAPSLEGFLFPDTYRFSRHATQRAMQEVMIRRFRAAATQIALTTDVYSTVTLASLVEKEVKYEDERRLAAGVFTNRLARGMPLQTDPSVVYAALLASRWTGTIRRSDLQFASPYNTYTHKGLPPGPICSPGIGALLAAMHPARTDKLYFVADVGGRTIFSGSLEEHHRHVEAYRNHLAPSLPR